MFFNQHLKQKAKVTMEYIFPEHNVSNKWPIRHKKHSTRSTSSTLELFSNQVETAQSSARLQFTLSSLSAGLVMQPGGRAGGCGGALSALTAVLYWLQQLDIVRRAGVRNNNNKSCADTAAR